MSIRTKSDHSEVKIIEVLPDFVFCGKRKPQVKVEFLYEELMYPEGFQTNMLIEDLIEDEPGEIAKAIEGMRK